MGKNLTEKKWRLASLIAAVALAVLPFASNAQDASSTADTASSTASSTQITTNANSNNVMQASVGIADNVFDPATITVPLGATVTWTNNGSSGHTVTADDASFDSGDLASGATFSHTFNSAGTFHYYCKHHGGPGGVGMAGVIFVSDTSNSESNTNASGSSSTSTNLNNGTSSSTTASTTTENNTGTSTSTSTSTLGSTGPSIPTNLTATAVSSSEIDLSWTASTSASSTGIGYVVFRNGTQVATTTATSYMDTGLAAGTAYTYMISAYDYSGNGSGESAAVTATTQSLTGSTGTSTSTPATSTMPGMPFIPGPNEQVYGWLIIPASLFNQIWGNATSTTGSTTPATQSPYTYNNGYPTINGNYVDCNGNIDNDMAHHTSNPNDTDPGHHIGQNCPAGILGMSNNNNPGNNVGNNPFSMMMPMMFNWYAGNNQTIPLVVIPLTNSTLTQLQSFWNSGTGMTMTMP